MPRPALFVVFAVLLAGAPFTPAVHAQAFLDPDYILPAEEQAYRFDQAPTIDGQAGEWADTPWTVAYYNDRDFNDDGLPDPPPRRDDYHAQYKAGWVAGRNVLYLLIELRDDAVFADGGTFHADGVEVRIDPLDEDPSGEPGDTESEASNFIFHVGQTTPAGVEGKDRALEAVWTVVEGVVPTRATLELAITLPDAALLQEGDKMGLHLLFNDNDPEDASPDAKNAVLQPFPQLWSSIEKDRVGVDETWSNVHFWSDLRMAPMPVVHDVAAGASIQAALDAAAPGDIVRVGPGEFVENLTVRQPRLRLVGTMTDTDTTRLVPADPLAPAILVSQADLAYGVWIEDITVDGRGQGAEGFAQTGIDVGNRDARIRGNVVTGFFSPLIVSGSDDRPLVAEGAVIEDNLFVGNTGEVAFNRPNSLFRYNRIVETGPGGYGLSVRGLRADHYVDIAFNTITNVRECGIGWNGEGTFAIHHNQIYRSYVERSGLGSGREMDDGLENQDPEQATSYIYNNTIVGWDSDGAQFNAPSLYLARNNLVAYNDNADYDLRNNPGVDIDYGLSFGNGQDLVTTLGANSLIADPLFVDETADDYALQAGSPAVDAGEPEPFGFKVYYLGQGPDIGALEFGDPTAIAVEPLDGETPDRYALRPNYPNPFNPTTRITYTVPRAARVRLAVYSLLGREVAVLVDGLQPPGTYGATWDGRDRNGESVPSGVYVYRIAAGDGFTATRSMTLIK